VLDDELLAAADEAAAAEHGSRSALVREALRRRLRDLDLARKEREEIEAYRRMSDNDPVMADWEVAGKWLDE
jgi:metal-responsive CopG/Arc/MetJ family transcriptional regulator